MTRTAPVSVPVRISGKCAPATGGMDSGFKCLYNTPNPASTSSIEEAHLVSNTPLVFDVRSRYVQGLRGENRWDRVEDAMAARRILVVDDYPNAAEALARWLRRMGNEVRTALDGVEGIHVAEQFRPEIVLLDIGMPKLGGYETAERIRSQPWGERMKLVALTGWAQEEEQQSLRKAGFDAHLVKPVDRTKLAALLAKYDAAWSTKER